jgi:hypothetical protein
MHGLDKIQRMIIGNILQGIGNTLNKVVLTNDAHWRFSARVAKNLIGILYPQ